MIPDQLRDKAAMIMEKARARSWRIAAAESCTGGLIAACFTEVAGSSDVFDSGFVTYSNIAKKDLLSVPKPTLVEHGAVSEPVARAMAENALEKTKTHLTVAVTGVAGPTGGSPDKPVGTVHMASACKAGATLHRLCQFGEAGRAAVRWATVDAALDLMDQQLS